MTDNKTQSLADYAEIRYLKPDTAKFELTEGGFLSLTISPDESYPRVDLFRAFPLTHLKEYISVRTTDGKEIGMIKSIDEFPKEIAEYLCRDLDRRYFKPVILSINSIKEEFGYLYWNVRTDAGTKKFTSRHEHESMLFLTETRIIIVDVDGNRYEIPDYTKLDEKSIKNLTPYL